MFGRKNTTSEPIANPTGGEKPKSSKFAGLGKKKDAAPAKKEDKDDKGDPAKQAKLAALRDRMRQNKKK